MFIFYKNGNIKNMKYLFFPTVNGVRGIYKKRSVSVFVDEGRKKISAKSFKRNYFLDIPLIRGVIYFVMGLIVFFQNFGESIKEEVKSKDAKKVLQKTKIAKLSVLYTIIGIVALFISLFLLGYLPSKISFLILGMEENFLLRNFIIALTKIILIFLVLLTLRFIPAMQELYKFNGAGNLVIKNKGEINTDKTLDYHYALNFLNFFVFAFILSTFVITLVGIRVSFWGNWLINFGLFIVCLSFSYEILYLLSLNNKLEKACVLTSFFVCMRPQLTHDEVARVAFSQLSMKEKFYGATMNEGKIALATVLSEMQTKLTKANRYDKSDVEWIIATVLGKNRAEAKLVRYFDEKTYKEIMKATEQRALGKPLSSIFGFVDFYGFRFNVNKKVLSPRMETEILVEQVIKIASTIKKCEILEIGTGSGAIAVSIARSIDAKVCAVDISKSALEVARQNASQNGAKVEFLESDIFSGIKKGKKFDIIVSNPPYIPSDEIESLDEEVKKFDPKLALDGGKDGLDFYRKIIEQASAHLNRNGYVAFEIGKGQFKDVKELLTEHNFFDIKGIKDYNKIYRVVIAKNGRSKKYS